MKNNKFHYQDREYLKKEIVRLNLDIPLSDNLDVLKESLKISSGSIIPNRLAVHPMEGADSLADGSPGELTLRRYDRYANGGSGLIWFEAVAVNEMGRANSTQLFLNEETVDSFKEMVGLIRQRARGKYGDDYKPYLVIQLTHVGRFGRHNKILFHHELVDQAAHIKRDQELMTDIELAELEEHFLSAAMLAKKAGFDAVDIKACHRYLLSENLAAHTRKGIYGGDYQNRTRLIKNALHKIKAEVEIDLASRLNLYDAIPYPFGWGTDKNGEEDHDEPRHLVRELDRIGVNLINITAATPYIYPHINRPYDQPNNIGYEPPEHPLIGVERLIRLAKIASEETENCAVVGTGYSYLRQFAPHVAAAVVEKGWSQLIGFGRQAFAYPDFAHDILTKGELEKSKSCITCSKCAELKANKRHCGCVIRDQEIYLPIYRDLLKEYKTLN